MATLIRCDLCVVGAGSGGLSVAAGAAQLGARVVLVEGGQMGGDCLNTGCVPSKALLSAARRLGPGPDSYPAAMDHVRATIAAISPHDSQARFEGLGVRVIRDWGRFTDPRTLRAGDALIRARRFVIATGSQPAVPAIPGLALTPHLTTDTIWANTECPGHLLILGAGAVGVEMAEAHARLGAQVTLVEAARALASEDPEATAVVLDALARLGVRLRQGEAVAAAGGRAGAVWLQLAGGDQVNGTHLLVATGRRPFLDRLDTAAAGVVANDRGIATDAGLRSTNRRVYAIGDAAGRGQFTHLAAYHAGLVIRSSLFGLPVRLRDDHIPRAIHTDPALAQIGLTEDQARARHGAAVTVSRVDFAQNDRARAEGRTDGFIKVVVHRGRSVGVTIVGAQAAELIAPWAIVLAGRLKLSLQASAVLPYPTLSEVSSRAASAYFAPKLFGNIWIKRIVRCVQRVFP